MSADAGEGERMTEEDIILVETDDRGVARVTLNRPDVRNALNETLIAKLTDAVAVLGAARDVRCIVLTGAGKAFCAGGDLNWMRRTAEYGFDENLADARTLGKLLHTVNSVPKPTIARINGAAFGGGVGLVACCDVAVAAEGAKLSLSEVRLGLAPATISPYVVAKMGASNARRYFLTAEVFGAAEASAAGLVHEVVAPDGLDGAVDALVDQILMGGPEAQAASKELIFRVAGRPVDDELVEWTARRIAEVRATPEGKEGAQAFLDKRPPAWQQG